jgi:membrane associated rhomboid family serine protease
LEVEQRATAGPMPTANWLLIAANIVMFAITWLTGWVWAVGPGTGLLSILLYGFCHAGMWHLVLNMWTLWVFGNVVNRRLGNYYYLCAYLGSVLVLGIIARVFYFGHVIGASGGIFAIITIALFLFPAARLVLAYWAIFPFSLIPALLRRPKYGIFWFVYGGMCRVKMIWCLALIVVLELCSLIGSLWSPYSSVWNVGHLLGVLCGVAIVLVLPDRITMRRRVMADAF